MARPARGQDVLEVAQSLLAKASEADELRTLQAVVFPIAYGMSTQETARAIGSPPPLDHKRAECIYSQRRDSKKSFQGGQKQSAYDQR